MSEERYMQYGFTVNVHDTELPAVVLVEYCIHRYEDGVGSMGRQSWWMRREDLSALDLEELRRETYNVRLAYELLLPGERDVFMTNRFDEDTDIKEGVGRRRGELHVPVCGKTGKYLTDKAVSYPVVETYNMYRDDKLRAFLSSELLRDHLEAHPWVVEFELQAHKLVVTYHFPVADLLTYGDPERG